MNLLLQQQCHIGRQFPAEVKEIDRDAPQFVVEIMTMPIFQYFSKVTPYLRYRQTKHTPHPINIASLADIGHLMAPVKVKFRMEFTLKPGRRPQIGKHFLAQDSNLIPHRHDFLTVLTSCRATHGASQDSAGQDGCNLPYHSYS